MTQSAMESIETRIWKPVIGKLPNGFSVRVVEAGPGFHLNLYYDGPSFQNLVEPGGVKPADEANEAYLGSISVHIDADKSEVRSFISALVERYQKYLQP
jgi:hypothetical protein